MRKEILMPAGVLLLCVFLVLPSCWDDPVSTGGDGGIDWPDLTDKEDPIATIQLCYDNYSTAPIDELMEHYTNVLYDDPDGVADYIWYMQDEDIDKYGEIMTLEQDINGTRYVLENANPLKLELGGTSWEGASEVCDECWKTTRTYTIFSAFIVDGEPKPYQGVLMRVTFVVGPHHDDPGKWAIYLAEDKPPAS